MSSILIRHGEIVLSEREGSFKSDIYIENGIIAAIDEHLEKPYAHTQEIDATNHFIFPGGVDPHVHMELPIMGIQSADNFYSGSYAALVGGTTCLIDFVTPEHKQHLSEALLLRKELAEKSACDYSLHMSITAPLDHLEEEMQQIVKEEGINSFKVYMAYRNTIGVDDAYLLKILKVAKKLKILVTLHCEDDSIVEECRDRLFAEGKIEPKYHPESRPVIAEAKAVAKAIELAKKVDTPIYIVHTSSKEAIELISAARKEGTKIYSETCPQYLLLDKSFYIQDGFEAANYVMSPPLRTLDDQEALWTAISRGDIQTIGTDHCPFDISVKESLGHKDFRKIPNGAGGVENRLELLYTYGVGKGRITLSQFVGLTSTNAAKIFGLYPRKGVIAVGSDADIVIWNPTLEKTISVSNQHQHCDRNIYQGFKIVGGPAVVIADGEIRFDHGEINIDAGVGKFIPRK